MQPIPPSDLFVTMAQIRDDLDTLIRRGKPVSAAELAQLLAEVRAKAVPTFESADIARLLGPRLVQAVPTPAAVEAAGTQAAAAIAAAVREATVSSKAELLAVAAAVKESADRIPRTVRLEDKGVGLAFTNGGSLAGFVGLVLVLLGLTGWALHSRAEARGEVATLQARGAKQQQLVNFFAYGRDKLAKERPTLAYQYFPYRTDPTPAKAAPAVKAKKKR
jgi:hypothetical protein